MKSFKNYIQESVQKRFKVTFTQPDWDAKTQTITSRKYDKTYDGDSFDEVNETKIKPYLATKEGHKYHSHDEYVRDSR